MEYVAFLGKKHLNTASAVYNYLSGVRNWVFLHKRRMKPFNLYHAKLAKKGGARHKANRPTQVLSQTVPDIKNIINCFSKLGK